MKAGQRTYSLPLAVAVMLSVTLHICTSAVLQSNFKHGQLTPLPKSVQVRIVGPKTRPQAAPVTNQRPIPKKTPNASAERANPPADSPDETYPDEKLNAGERPYEDLFPGPAWPAGTVTVQRGSGDGDARRGPPPSTAAQKIAGHLSGQLDIPLIFRENTAQSRATAKFRRKNDGAWYFEYIDGEPVLRAVLYEAFHQQKNLVKIDELASLMKKHEIIFVLEQRTKPALNGWEQFSDAISYEGIKIIYNRTIFTGSDGSSGIALPDKEAERAVMRDQVALKRLMASPAYISPIRGRKILAK